MSRSIPVTLRNTMEQDHALSMCPIVKIGPLFDDSYRYLSGATHNISYNDGNGLATYIGRTGMQASAFVSSSDLGVDNAEMDTLPPASAWALEGITEAQVRSGELDNVPFVVYYVDYRNPTEHFIGPAGRLGEARIRGSALFNFEWRSLSNNLNTTLIGEVDSRSCRAIHGSQYFGTGGGVVEEMFPCRFDAESTWVNFNLSGVHPTDTDLTVYATDLAGYADDYFRPGLMRALTGANAGLEREIGAFSVVAGEAVVTLKYAFPHPFSETDTAKIRRSCTKYPFGHNSCSTYFAEQWVNRYRGEPWQPVADAGVLLVPGAGVPSDTGGTGENPPPVQPPPVEVPGGGTGTPGTPTERDIGPGSVDANTHGASTAASAATNTAAVNAALAALPGGGGEVYFSVPGTYAVTVGNTSNLIVLDGDHTRLNLDGVVLQAANPGTRSTSSSHRDVIRVDGPTEWEITGGSIIGYRDNGWTPPASGTGTDEWGHCIFVTGGATAGTIKSITCTKAVGDGVSLGRTASDIHIEDYVASYCRRQGISTGASQVLIENFVISYIGGSNGTKPMAGIDVEVDSPNTATDVTIRNGRVHHCTGPGLLAVVRTSNIVIESVVSEYNANYGGLFSSANNVTVKGCTFQFNKYQGVKWENGATGGVLGGSGPSDADINTFRGNMTSTHGVVTTGNSTTISGQSSVTHDHVLVESGCVVNVRTNKYAPA